jgi:hypothetical protein
MRGPKRSDDYHGQTTNNLAAIAVVLLVVMVALVTTGKLQVRSILAECMAAQRPACEAMVERLRVSRLIDRLWNTGT